MIKSQSTPDIKMNNTYPHSTIAEALCEIHFDSDVPQKPITDVVIKKLKGELSLDYPSVTEQQIKQLQASITDLGISVDESKNSSTRVIFKHKDRNHILQFLPNVLTINEVNHYPGWDNFLGDIFRGWRALNSGFTTLYPKRIGLRYINLVPRKNNQEHLSAWLKPSKYYPEAILNSSKDFLARNEFKINENIRLIVTLSEPIQDKARGNFIFDIDVISLFNKDNVNLQEIEDKLITMHNLAWEVFSSSLTQKYTNLLNGELL